MITRLLSERERMLNRAVDDKSGGEATEMENIGAQLIDLEDRVTIIITTTRYASPSRVLLHNKFIIASIVDIR